MSEVNKYSWRLAGIDLQVVWPAGPSPAGNCELRPKNRDGHLLSSLIMVAPEQVAECALEIVIELGYTCVDCGDAVDAYTLMPLRQPPQEYLARCHAADIPNNPTRELLAVVLAGSDRPQDRALLHNILANSCEDMRDAPILTASSLPAVEFLDEIAAIAMSVSEDSATGGTGEMYALATCFNRWIDRKECDLDQVHCALQRHAKTGNDAFMPKRFLNYMKCPNWDMLRMALPYFLARAAFPPAW